MALAVADKLSALVVFLGGWTGVIACRFCSLYREYLDQTIIFLIGIVCLVSVIVLTILVRDKRQPFEPLYFVFMICTFSSCADLLISLEADEVISGWAKFYLADGEPYLGSPHGAMICLWDFFGHYILYAVILYAMSCGKSTALRNSALYWFGSIFNSLLVFLPGNVLGTYKVHLSYLLNTPYVLVPLYVLYRVTREERPQAVCSESQRRIIILRPFDLLLLLGTSASLIIAFIRGLAALNCSLPFFRYYLDSVEPYIRDSDAYPRLQILVYLFYFTIIYCLTIFALISPGCHWMLDVAAVHAGAAAQAQFSYMGGSVHWRTPAKLHPPEGTIFWLVNSLLLILPHIVAARVLWSPNFFLCRSRQNNVKVAKD